MYPLYIIRLLGLKQSIATYTVLYMQ